MSRCASGGSFSFTPLLHSAGEARAGAAPGPLENLIQRKLRFRQEQCV
ncbi:hypothetical protein HMPREF0201_00740 [Cedecea davisae DSM 4568]|uniref:Uncharacterized protein n=1 Tax=Cedecea davisae DSM 4568 TaxID=566551 RepID=S3J4K7_9ENTR|nr:hypothetical protein HMPREF0201_00740 [Cedecea davisae DSM 4568]